jgi:hypothetical protein
MIHCCLRMFPFSITEHEKISITIIISCSIISDSNAFLSDIKFIFINAIRLYKYCKYQAIYRYAKLVSILNTFSISNRFVDNR